MPSPAGCEKEVRPGDLVVRGSGWRWGKQVDAKVTARPTILIHALATCAGFGFAHHARLFHPDPDDDLGTSWARARNAGQDAPESQDGRLNKAGFVPVDGGYTLAGVVPGTSPISLKSWVS